MNSFIGSGSIWPEPDAEVCVFTFSFLAFEKPASVISLRASFGSYLIWNFGLPRHGWPGSKVPLAGAISPPSRPSFMDVAVDAEIGGLAHADVVPGRALDAAELPRPDMRLLIRVDRRSRAA